MVTAFNPDTKTVTVVSLPRDTKIELKGYKSNKANAYYPIFLSKEKESGVKATDEMKTMMSKYMDIPIDYVTVLNFQGFRDAVDALGGVDINVDADMCYRDTADGTNINLKKASRSLTGRKRWITCVTANPTAVRRRKLPTILTATAGKTKCCTH